MYDDSNLRTVADLLSILTNPAIVGIALAGMPEERSNWIFKHLRRFKHHSLGKKDAGVVLRYPQLEYTSIL